MKVGVLGGAFDPPHIGHLILAEFACKYYKLDKVIFMPYNRSYNKIPICSPQDRLAMVRLAIGSVAYFVLDEREIVRGGVTYTVDTVLDLFSEDPSLDIYWIIGEDAMRSLSSWKEWKKLVKLIKFIVAKRHGCKLPKSEFILELEMPEIKLSSSLIRKRIEEGKTVRFLLPERVYDYVFEKGLYRKQK